MNKSTGKLLRFGDALAEKMTKTASKSGKGFSPISAPDRGADDADQAEYVWWDVEYVEDNPVQPRDAIVPDSDQQRELVEQINQDGQEQPSRGQLHPTKPGWVQLISGHRRKYAVKEGALFFDEDHPEAPPRLIHANAGSNLPEPKQYIGKLLIRLDNRPAISRLEKRRRAYQENRSRSNLNAMEDARVFKGTQDDMTAEAHAAGTLAPNKIVSERAVAKFLGERDHTRVHRGLSLLTLPPKMQIALEKGIIDKETKKVVFELNERHGRGLLVLKNFPKEQRQLFRDIAKDKISGAKAEEFAIQRLKFLQEKTPSLEEAANPSVPADPKNDSKSGAKGLAVVGSGSTVETKTSSTVADLKHLPKLVSDQLVSAGGAAKQAANGLALLNIVPEDLETYEKQVNSLERQVSRLKREIRAHKKRQAETESRVKS